MNTQMTYGTAMLVALMTLGSARVEATEGD